jgi:hypothetical protein
MGEVRITQLDGKLPNLALMRLSSWHRARGDTIHFTRSPHRDMFEPEYKAVYGSAIFKFSAGQVAKFREAFPAAIVGGTWLKEENPITVEKVIGDWQWVDYSIAPPDFKASIGFTQRGCRLKCDFCVVPWKEGKPRAAGTIADIWRGPGHPKHLHLLDNDFFGEPQWPHRIAEIRDGGFKVSFTQGINIRMINDEVAAAIASIQYRDDQFQRRRLYTAWDNLKNEKVFFRGVDTLERHGIPPKHLMAYMLIGFDEDETWERIHHRFDRMVARGIRPYPMVFDNSRRDLKRFQRWVVTGLYRAFPFSEYDASIKTKRPMPASPIQGAGHG